MIIYKLTDRIPVVIGEIKFWISPLSFEQKRNVLAQVKLQAGEEKPDHVAMAYLAMKYSIKGLEGLECADGSPYSLSFDADGTLSADSLSEIFQLECKESLIAACSSLMNGFKEYEIPGVKIDLKAVRTEGGAKKNAP